METLPQSTTDLSIQQQLEAILHDLIRMNRERSEAFYKAARQLKRNEELRLLCEEFAEDSDIFADELRRTLVHYYPYVTHCPQPKVYRPLSDPNTTFTSYDPNSVLNTCVFGEENIQKAYQTAMAFCADTQQAIYTILSSQSESLQEASDELKSFHQVAALRHAV